MTNEELLSWLDAKIYYYEQCRDDEWKKSLAARREEKEVMQKIAELEKRLADIRARIQEGDNWYEYYDGMIDALKEDVQGRLTYETDNEKED